MLASIVCNYCLLDSVWYKMMAMTEPAGLDHNNAYSINCYECLLNRLSSLHFDLQIFHKQTKIII